MANMKSDKSRTAFSAQDNAVSGTPLKRCARAMPACIRYSSGRRSDDGLKSAAFNQQARVIVNDHREQARSYRA